MNASLNYCWRLAATGGSFAMFGIGGLLLSAFVFPLLKIFPGNSRLLRARWIIHKAFSMFLGFMQAVGIMRLEVHGAERLRDCRHTLVLANHPTLIDVVALVSLMPTASCVVKDAVWNSPLMGGVVRAANYISNSEPERLLDDCAEDLAAGNPLLIFPEGTRSQPGMPLRFLRGASYIAIKSGMSILPVLIDCKPSTLTKRERWFQIPARRFHLRIDVLEPLTASRWLDGSEPQTIAARKLTQALEAYFTRELLNHERAEA